jgi:hypothetical protein
MGFPDHCLRGVKDKQHVSHDKPVNPAVFYFDRENDTPNVFWEMSVNWQDDESVIAFTVEQRRSDGRYEFLAGCVTLSREDIDGLSKLRGMRGILSYERKPMDGNQYHGNLLLTPETPKELVKRVAMALIFCVGERHLR